MYFSLAKFQLVSCNLSLAMIWQIIYTHKLPKLCSATLKYGFVFMFPNNPQNLSPGLTATFSKKALEGLVFSPLFRCPVTIFRVILRN